MPNIFQTLYPAFGEYFINIYCSRIKQWAMCYRVGTPMNTNMNAESFHRVLKIVYLQQKHNRRMDSLIYTLLKISRYKSFEQLMKLEKGKHTHRICDINKRHRTAVSFAHLATITCSAEDSFKVSSESRNRTYSTVLKVQSQCYCRLKCQFCSVCAHQYTCTCLDPCANTTVCKHIHLVRTRGKTIYSTVNHAAMADLRYYSAITVPLSLSESQEGSPKLPPPRDVLLSNLQKATTNSLTKCSKCCDTNAIERAYNMLEYNYSKRLNLLPLWLIHQSKMQSIPYEEFNTTSFFSTRKRGSYLLLC